MPPFRPPTRIEIAYRREISDALRQLLPELSEGVSEGEWLMRLAALSNSPNLLDVAVKIAGRMVRWIEIDNAKSWKHASRQSQRSQYLSRLLQEELSGPVGARLNLIVKQNAQLISSVPYKVATLLTGEIAEAAQLGARHETMARMMRERFPALTKSRISLIARTETSKAATALTEARSAELDLPAYIWRTSEDARVRTSHRHMNGVLIFWSDPPSPEQLIGIRSSLGHYQAGAAPQCRCYPEPVLDIRYLKWPMKVYSHDQIERLTKGRFLKRFASIMSPVAA